MVCRISDLASRSGVVPASLLAELKDEAHRLATDESRLPLEQRWERMQESIAEATKGAKAQRGLDGHGSAESTEMALEAACKACIIEERDAVLCSQLAKLPGPLVVGVVGVAHLEGISRRWKHMQQSAAGPSDSSVDESQLYEAPRLPLWRRVVGRPLLSRLRGKL
eukprot:gnl/TRDRNA2_/TRDRNA2_92619_c0_seq4.p1 gnl/TRDRNA2_/TRDRNA2_92619_c0~~gnl/TRDRNA2_/TRDRNA2_92619_c0_seq4.p1  ORF type:complete len:166 (+),score=25.89 gnl/TRDRNA2_/TRDRNA2_92619_c0_seq4:369-866(+)